MKKIAFLLFGILPIISFSQEDPRTFKAQVGDSTYVMKKYFICFLKKGPNREMDSVKTAQIQEAHLAHINTMAKAGKVAIAGPFGDDGDIRGILVFDVATAEEVEKLTSKDPAVKAGRLVMEIHPWWAAKGSVLP